MIGRRTSEGPRHGQPNQRAHPSAPRRAAVPAPNALPDPAHAIAHDAALGPADGPAPRARVLIADDEPTITHVMALIIEGRGQVALVAEDGREALELARAHHPHLVITDLMMPHLDGAGLVAALRAEAKSSGRQPIPVILMSGARTAALTAVPADAVLIKPFHVEDVLALLDRFLGPVPPRT